MKDYTHELNKEVRSISAQYVLDREGRIEKGGREILYAVGNALVDSSCCGLWGCRFAVVPGYVVKWKYTMDDLGQCVSLVDPITDETLRQDLTRELEAKEGVSQVGFW